jgi:hypothetical protein
MIDNNSAMPAPFSTPDFASFYGSNVLGNHYIAAMVNSAGQRDSARRGGASDLAKTADQFRGTDVNFWGIVALVAWGVAVLSANISASIPDSVLGGLHASRLDGANLNQLRGEIAELGAEAAELRQQNTVLLQRFMLNEQSSGQVTRRVGALELSIPRLLEAIPADADVDRGTTASTGGGKTTSFDVDGGSVSYTQTPLSGQTSAPAETASQPMPQALTSVTPDSSAFGIALGPPIDAGEAELAWQSMSDKVGTLLIGLGPLVANVEGGAGKRLVAGPIATEADARQLCGRMARIGIACASVPFIGEPLPLLN